MSSELSPNKIGVSVGEKIRAARVALHYTQSKLAAPDFSVSYVSAIERGQIHPSLRALEIFASRLGITVTSLLPPSSTQDGQDTMKLRHPTHDENDYDMVLLTAHVLISQNEPMQALTLLEKTSAKRLKYVQQLWRRYLFGYAHLKAHQEQAAERFFSELSDMLATSKTEPNYYLSTHLLYMQGMVSAAMQDPTQALDFHQRCLRKLEEGSVHDTFLMAQTYVQLGRHYIHLNQNFDALTMFYKSIEVFGYIETKEQVLALCANLMHYARSYNDSYVTELYAYRARLFSELEGNKKLRDEAFYYLGLIIMQENQEEALVQFSALQEQEKSNALVLASINTRIAEWHFTHGDKIGALSCAKNALLLAKPFGNTIILADALLLLGKIEYALELMPEGDEHYVQGISLLERLRSKERNKYLLQYAQILEAQERAQEALHFFRRAYQSSVQ